MANPPVMMAWISDRVKRDKYGLMMKGAVAWPRNMFAAAFNDSQAVVPRNKLSSNFEINKIACFKVKLSWTRGSFFVFPP